MCLLVDVVNGGLQQEIRRRKRVRFTVETTLVSGLNAVAVLKVAFCTQYSTA